MPRKHDAHKRRVCSKGCNLMKKTPNLKPKAGAIAEKDLYGIAVCQVDWRVICEPKPKGSKKRQGSCKTTKSVRPVAVCPSFESALWNVGGSSSPDPDLQSDSFFLQGRASPTTCMVTRFPSALSG